MEEGRVFATSGERYMVEPKMARRRYWCGLVVGSCRMVWGGLECRADGGQSVCVICFDSWVMYYWP